MTKCELILKQCGLSKEQVQSANGRHMHPVTKSVAVLIVFDERPQPKPRPRREPHHSLNAATITPTAVARGLYGCSYPIGLYCGDYGYGCFA